METEQPPSAPEPARPLGPAGQALWARVWSAGAPWLTERVDCEQVLLLCEQLDERQALRLTVLRSGDWRERGALRALDAQIMDGLAVLGFNPTDRLRLGSSEARPATAKGSKLDELSRARARRGATTSDPGSATRG